MENSRVNTMAETCDICDTCLYGDSDCSREVNNQGCEYHYRIETDKNDSMQLEQTIENIRRRVKALGSDLVGKKLSRNSYNYFGMGITYREDFDLDRYYVGLINDTLHNIRHNKLAWVFNLKQVEEVFRFEPDVEVTYDVDDGVYYLA